MIQRGNGMLYCQVFGLNLPGALRSPASHVTLIVSTRAAGFIHFAIMMLMRSRSTRFAGFCISTDP